MLQNPREVAKLLQDSLLGSFPILDAEGMGELMIQRLGKVGCKTALRLAERALSSSSIIGMEVADEPSSQVVAATQLSTLDNILDDVASDQAASEKLCEVFF